ncbi:MAG: hypothetical protein HZA89_04765 [Verrucomicrobia bacterium]|nr:hypothetical protein [Verrucomicrobiota bacterium]
MKSILRQFARNSLVLIATAGFASSSGAFSLLGPFTSWQSGAIGYNLVGDIGGPMNLGEEYRMTTPILTYGYDATFLNFFGSNGVLGIEAAMTILNSVPAASAMSASLAEFPVQAVGPVNTTASSLRIIDIKSLTLSVMLEQMGLASPERWSFTLRDRTVANNVTNYVVVQRNFDPINWRPTNTVNGVLRTYSVNEPLLPGNYTDAEETVVSGNVNNISVASLIGGNGFFSSGFGAGSSFTGLTRDDYGALRYLLRFNNANVETLGAGVSLANITSPYGPFLGTNAQTNVAIATARRPGIERVSFNGLAIDSLLGVSIRAVTNRYVDVFFHPTNFTLTNQSLQRVTTIPDVVFTAGDLHALFLVPPGGSGTLTRSLTSRWVNNATLNTVGGGGGLNFGPGVIPAAGSNTTAIVVTFDTVGPSRLNLRDATRRFIDERSSFTNFVWGYFDATTIYSVFPDGVTIQDLERQLYGR